MSQSTMPPARAAKNSAEGTKCPHCGAPVTVPRRAAAEAAGAYEPLSKAQFKVLGLLNLGFTTKEMAAALNLSAGTVRWHLNHIFARLHVRNRTEAVVKARALKLF